MDKEAAKAAMLGILLELLTVECDIDLEEVGPILQRHLGLGEADMDEVMNRFAGEVRDAFAAHPAYTGSRLAQALDEAERLWGSGRVRTPPHEEDEGASNEQ